MRHKLRIDSDAKINFISMSKYAEAEGIEKSGRDKIAVIYAEGNIVDGTGDRDRIGGETYRNHIRRARTDKSIKAIVIRINSGGGSAAASEQMWREVDLARKEKPVIVSFGDVAASGGYYMACAADSIFVQPNTITGSIGVFGILPNMENFFRKKLGVTFDEVSTSPGGSISITKPLTPLQKKSFQSQIDSIYSNFKLHVASGRKKSPDYIETVAQGRVWSGTRAVEIGLADRIGSLDDAIAAAAAKAKITDYRLREYPGRQTFFEMLFEDNKDAKKETMIREELGPEIYKTYSTVRNIQQMIGQAQARMPYEIVID
jgi:protease-4